MAIEQEDDTADLEIMPTAELEQLLDVSDEPARGIDSEDDPGFDPYNRV